MEVKPASFCTEIREKGGVTLMAAVDYVHDIDADIRPQERSKKVVNIKQTLPWRRRQEKELWARLEKVIFESPGSFFVLLELCQGNERNLTPMAKRFLEKKDLVDGKGEVNPQVKELLVDLVS